MQTTPQTDIVILSTLIQKMQGRRAKARRLQRCKTLVRRDPVGVAWRYLRRHAGGLWHRGGNHVARLNYGPGIAFSHTWRNDRDIPITASPLNFAA